ncbi:GDSL-like Lipase/Acylhydrolase [Luteitalea pratensis]|uniref:GDSL-like Lipase/Acylhydrolase n=2 Tax=Luteitalea pratensis TaxID=1855912 RepID=A0A143PHQ0_LUTPR|nr:GDSL-like Lipase/Acylhydrolase [Luteitalea pratensis]
MLRLLVLVLTTIVASACAEVAFRWHVWRRFELKFPPWTDNLVRLPAPQVFELKPNATGVFPGGVDPTRTFPYRTNAHGLRDRDRSGKKLGTKRVLVIGDSYTWGYAVAEEEAYPQVAERLLKERGHPDIEVINGGVPDYNSRQERQLLERLLPVYEPDAVVLSYVMNDAEPSTALPTPPDETYRHANSWFLAELAEVANRHLFKRRVFETNKDTVSGAYLEGFASSSSKWKDSKQAMREMRDLCAAARIPFVVVILPDFTQDFGDRYGFQPIHDAVASWGRELNVPVHDLLIPLRGEDHQSLSVPWDGHPNAEAHRRLAEFLVGRILEAPGLSTDRHR